MGDLLERFTTLEALWSAAHRAARGKRGRASVARTLLELEPTILRLQAELRAGTWQPGRPSQHQVQDQKRRVITAAPFEDRIVHQALCAEVGPLLERHLIRDSYACRLGRGTHAALSRATVWTRSYPYFVHLDVVKYFPSIDHELLLEMLERDIPCARTVALCRRILAAGAPWSSPARFHFPGDDLFTPWERPAGLPIGNLTSQHFANRFLSAVDHRAKDRLRIRPYLRYMDDMLLFDDDRPRLEDAAHSLEELAHGLRLRLHPWQVRPTREGVSFVGYRVLPDSVRVRRSTVARAEKRLAEKLAAARADRNLWPAFFDSLRATFAHWDHADSWRLRERTLRRLGLLLEDGDEGARYSKRERGKKAE
jgi:RNA-directed DNA polymerase